MTCVLHPCLRYSLPPSPPHLFFSLSLFRQPPTLRAALPTPSLLSSLLITHIPSPFPLRILPSPLLIQYGTSVREAQLQQSLDAAEAARADLSGQLQQAKQERAALEQRLVESQQHTARLEDECTTMSAALETNQKLHDAKVNELQLALQQQSEELHKAQQAEAHQAEQCRKLLEESEQSKSASVHRVSELEHELEQQQQQQAAMAAALEAERGKTQAADALLHQRDTQITSLREMLNALDKDKQQQQQQHLQNQQEEERHTKEAAQKVSALEVVPRPACIAERTQAHTHTLARTRTRAHTRTGARTDSAECPFPQQILTRQATLFPTPPPLSPSPPLLVPLPPPPVPSPYLCPVNTTLLLRSRWQGC